MASYASSECHDACISQQTVPVSELAVSVDAVSVCGRVLGGVHQQMNVVGHLEHGFPLRQTMVRTRQYRHTHDAAAAFVSLFHSGCRPKLSRPFINVLWASVTRELGDMTAQWRFLAPQMRVNCN